MGDEVTFSKALNHISEAIREYRQMEELDGVTLNRLLQQITGTLFYLEKERAEFHHLFQSKIREKVSSGMSVARAENEAHEEVPQMYMLRRIMDSAYEVAGAIRSNISWLKTEMQNA